MPRKKKLTVEELFSTDRIANLVADKADKMIAKHNLGSRRKSHRALIEMFQEGISFWQDLTQQAIEVRREMEEAAKKEVKKVEKKTKKETKKDGGRSTSK